MQRSPFGDITHWTANSRCVDCGGKLRGEGDANIRIKDAADIGKALIDVFDPFAMVKNMVTGIGSVVIDEIQGRKSSILRQCDKCGKFTYKCPKCLRLSLSPRRPPVLGSVKTTCPHCQQKVVLYEFGSG